MFVAPWRPRRSFWIALGVYCFVSVLLALAVSQGDIDVGLRVGAPIAALMLALVGFAMLTQRGDWAWWERVVFFACAFAGHAFLTVLFAVATLPLMAIHPFVSVCAATLFASLPFVVVALWESRVFVERRA